MTELLNPVPAPLNNDLVEQPTRPMYPDNYYRTKLDLPISISVNERGDRLIGGDVETIARQVLSQTQIVMLPNKQGGYILNQKTNIWRQIGSAVRDFLLVSVLYPQAQEWAYNDYDGKMSKFLARVADRMYEIVRGEPMYEEGFFNNMTDAQYDYIGDNAYFSNGAFNIKTMKLHPFKAEHYRTDDTILPRPISQQPVTFKQIQQNRIYQAVDFFTDEGSEKAMCEYIGSAFFENKPEPVHMQIVVSRGTRNGGNGKSILMTKIIGAPLFGKMYTEIPSNRAFNTKGEFNSALLVGKQLIFIDELNPYTLEPEVFKQQITATRLKVNEKNKPEYDSRFGGHFAGASNDEFKIRDSSDGSLRRILTVVFNKQVTVGEDKVTFMKNFNPDFSEEMREALSDPEVCAEFTRWCVQQYSELLARRAQTDSDEFVWSQSEEANYLRDVLKQTKTPVIDIAFNSGLFEYTGVETDVIELKLFTDGVLLANKYNTDDRSRITRKLVLADMRDYMYNNGKRSRIRAVCTNRTQQHPDNLNPASGGKVYVSGFKLAHDDLDSDLENAWFETIKKHLGKKTVMEEVFDVYVTPDEVF